MTTKRVLAREMPPMVFVNSAVDSVVANGATSLGITVSAEALDEFRCGVVAKQMNEGQL